VGVVSSAVIGWLVGRNLLTWVRSLSAAAAQIGRGNYEHRIPEDRPDEFGGVQAAFNDMAQALGRGRLVTETFGQFVEPDVRDEILLNHPGLGGEVRELTVLFIDIRGFTRRSTGAPPDQVVDLLNRFFSLAVAAVRGRGGWVNKFPRRRRPGAVRGAAPRARPRRPGSAGSAGTSSSDWSA